MLAGIIAARTNDHYGIAGVAPKSVLISYRMRPGYEDEIARGIRFVVDRGARVVNLSLGSLLPWDPVATETPVVNRPAVHLDPALRYAWKRGALVVAAAGNSSSPLCSYPAFDANTLCVGATDARDLKAPYSNFGLRLDLVAPGGLAHGTCPGTGFEIASREGILGTTDLDYGNFDCGWRGYRFYYGTSFAAPHVSGVAALLFSLGLDNREVMTCLTRTATDLGAPGWDPLYGHGLVNAYRAVRTCRP